MKKIKIVLSVSIAILLITACTRTCKIDGCKNEVYKEGLCQKHYYVNQGADAIGNVVNGVLDAFK